METTNQVPLPLPQVPIPQVPPQVRRAPRNEWRARIGGSEFKILRMQDAPFTTPAGDTPEHVYNYLRQMLPDAPAYNPDVESFVVVCLNTRRKIIGFSVIATGTLDTLHCHAREVFKCAIITNAACIVLAHNHPSGDPTPSEGDIKVTRDLIRGGQILKIEVLDHIILGTPNDAHRKAYSSLRELGYFYS